MQKNFWLVLVLVIGGLIGLFILTGEKDSTSSVENYDPTVIRLEDNIDGLEIVPETQAELDAALENKVVVVEYVDFQCPGCSFFFQVMKQLKLDFEGDLVTVFRHFPITTIHPQAMAAHRASVAAGNQGMFWEMHDLLFERQNDWSGQANAANIFTNYATELGLDIDLFATDVEDILTFDLITNDVESSSDYGIISTPSVLLNGEKLEETPSYEDFKTLIEEALES